MRNKKLAQICYLGWLGAGMPTTTIDMHSSKLL